MTQEKNIFAPYRRKKKSSKDFLYKKKKLLLCLIEILKSKKHHLSWSYFQFGSTNTGNPVTKESPNNINTNGVNPKFSANRGKIEEIWIP